MQITALTEHFGSRVDDIDLGKPLDDATVDALRALLGSRLLLVFPGQDLTGAQQVAFLAGLGEVVDEGGDGLGYVFVSNARQDGVLAHGRPLLYHSDNVFTPNPLNVVALYGLAVADDAAPTRFVDTAHALDLVAADLRAELEPASALNLSGFTGGSTRYRDAETEAHHPRAVHPVVRHDARAGRPVLFVSHQQTDAIVDWPAERSEQTLQHLFTLLYRDDNIYEHHWRNGDLVVWNNLALQHGRPELPSGAGERTLRRTALVDERDDSQRAWTLDTLAAEAAERAADAVGAAASARSMM